MTVVLIALGCTAPQAGSGSTAREARATADTSAETAGGRTLVMAIRVEPASLASKPLEAGGVTLTTTRRLFNATLAIYDGNGQITPYVASSLPALDTPSWKMLDDGGMETTYTLKPSVTWQDGIPLDGDDFVFAWQVYATPELGLASSPPINQMDRVEAPDPSTVVIRWKRPYAQAGMLTEAFPPLPKHLLERSFQQSPESFASLPYWTRDYIGLGPYKVDRWEPGSFIEASAYSRHTGGQARIEHLKIVFIGDPNTTVANMLSGEVQLSADDSLRFQQGLTLKQQWGDTGGTVIVKPDLWRGTYVQLRPELTTPRALLDVRMRAALAYAIDRDALNSALFEGQGIMGDLALIPPSVAYYADASRGATKYTFDLPRSEQLMSDAGILRGSDGMYVSPEEGRLTLDLRTNGSTQNESELSILAAGWRTAGFDVKEMVVPQAQAQDGQVRSSFPALYTFSTPLGEDTLASHTTVGIPSADNRWIGNNRGGWSNARFDAVSAQFATTLNPTQRVDQIRQMASIFSEELPALPLYFNPIPMAHTAALTGPKLVPAESAVAWNVQDWELK